jgi:hypothetical protein
MEGRSECTDQVGKCEGRSRHRWEDNLKTDFTEISWEGMAWIDLPLVRDSGLAIVTTGVNVQVCKMQRICGV